RGFVQVREEKSAEVKKQEIICFTIRFFSSELYTLISLTHIKISHAKMFVLIDDFFELVKEIFDDYSKSYDFHFIKLNEGTVCMTNYKCNIFFYLERTE